MAKTSQSSSKPKRLLAVSSGGGHWIELVRLSAAFDSFDTLYATTVAPTEPPSGPHPVRIIADASRSHPMSVVRLALQLSRLLVGFRPHLIVTTGAAPGLVAISLGKLMGAKCVWIDSLANAEELSLSGRLARPWADLRLTQWEDLADEESGIAHFGRVI